MTATERFLRYVKFDTQSDEDSGLSPSTDKQKIFGNVLVQELKTLGLENPYIDDYGYVYAWLPASKGCENLPCTGLIAHMDTSPSAPGADINPKIIRYEGGDIILNKEKNIITYAKDFEKLEKYKGQELIVTDGTTLLGADDKAGIAEIMSAMEFFVSNPEIKHPKIAVAFTPDEEIGQGSDFFDIQAFGASAAYTVDGDELGTIEYENFNAADAVINIRGVGIHPGSAKNKMKNASLIATEFITMLPPEQTPSHTEGYEGFYHLENICGDVNFARLRYIIRDHNAGKFTERKNFLEQITDFINKKYGDGTAELSINDSYRNMKEMIEPHIYLIEKAKKAMEALNIEPAIVPIRGGTDGAQLSYRGLPCPNLCTGGLYFHGVHEFIPTSALETMTRVLVELTKAI